MVAEILIAGLTVVSCASCWAMVVRHRITSELERHKINVNAEVLRPIPEPVKPEKPVPPTPHQMVMNARQQSLDALLARRASLENHITQARENVTRYSDKSYAQYRAEALSVLEDARKEQNELVLEQTGLLEMMEQEINESKTRVATTPKPVQSDPGGLMAQRVEDPSLVCDVELHESEAGRESTA